MDEHQTPGAIDPDLARAATATESKRSSQAFTGVLLVTLGLIFFVDRVGWQWGWPYRFRELWPLLIIAAGIWTTFTSRQSDVVVTKAESGEKRIDVRPTTRRRIGDGFFAIMVGVLLLLHVNHWVRLDQTWPLFIVAVGLSILFSRRKVRARVEDH